MTMNNENYEHCKTIAENLEQVASGDYFMYDGELFPIDADDFSEVKGCRYDEENDMYIMADGEELRQRIYIAIHLPKHQQRSARSQLGTVFQ